MMINQSMASSNPEVERLIREMLSENARYERDLRSAHRESLVCPITIELTGETVADEPLIHGFSRNISVSGVCILCDSAIEVGARAKLEIYRLNQEAASRVRAEVRWCKPFGHRFFASGWQFLGMVRD